MKNIENKTIRISVRVSEEELKIIEKRASLTNEKSLSSYLRKQARIYHQCEFFRI